MVNRLNSGFRFGSGAGPDSDSKKAESVQLYKAVELKLFRVRVIKDTKIVFVKRELWTGARQRSISEFPRTGVELVR